MKIIDNYAYPDWDNYYCNNLLHTVYGHPTRELTEKQFLIEYFKNKNIINSIDVGAHIGFHSLFLSNICQNVCSFEANPDNFSCFQYNTRNIKNIHGFNFAIGDKNDSCKIEIPWDFPIKENINSGMGYITDGKSTQMKRLDDLYLSDINFIKIDVEGYEYFVLNGAKQLLSNNHILIMFESNGNESRFNIKLTDIQNLLESLNYKFINQIDQNIFYSNYES